jgi:hypothetical protein
MMGVYGFYNDGSMLSAVPIRPPWELVGTAIENPATAYNTTRITPYVGHPGWNLITGMADEARLTPSIGFCAMPSTMMGAGMPVASRIVGTISMTWWNWVRMPPLGDVPASGPYATALTFYVRRQGRRTLIRKATDCQRARYSVQVVIGTEPACVLRAAIG